MGYSDFLEVIARNTSNTLDGYRDLCRICLQNQPNSVDISENSCSAIKRREAIRSNYIAITKQSLPTSNEHPKFVCTTCETSLSQFALFAQLTEENAENWEIFLSSRRMEEHANIATAIKVEFCEEKCDDDPMVADTHNYDALDVPLKIEEIYIAPLDDVPATDKPKRRIKKKPKLSFVTTEFERTCQHCDEPTFSSLTRLYSHQKLIHPDIRAYSCDLCGNKFRSKDAVVRHMRERHASNGRRHQCQFCAKLFYTDREVKGHEKCHMNERSYICGLCGKGFNNKSELNSHTKSKVHNADYKVKKCSPRKGATDTTYKKVYRCTLCVPAAVFSNPLERTDHRNLMHKIYDCDVCKNSFLTMESLNRHKLLHSNKPRPHVCSVCNATFNQASHLTSHIKCKHTDRAYQCSFCDKMFSENFNRTAHENLVHKKGERAKCNECEADFSSTKYLQRHMVERHSTKPSPYDCQVCGKKNNTGQMLALHRLKFHRHELF